MNLAALLTAIPLLKTLGHAATLMDNSKTLKQHGEGNQVTIQVKQSKFNANSKGADKDDKKDTGKSKEICKGTQLKMDFRDSPPLQSCQGISAQALKAERMQGKENLHGVPTRFSKKVKQVKLNRKNKRHAKSHVAGAAVMEQQNKPEDKGI